MSQIKDDIDQWSDNQLKIWVTDSMSRYEMMGASHQEAFANTLTNLMYGLAKCIAVTDGSSKEAGAQLTVSIDRIRLNLIKRLREQSGEATS